MINKNSIAKSIIGITSLALFLVFFAFSSSVSAQTTSITTTSGLTRVITRSDRAITTRLNVLNNLSTRIGEMKNVSASEQSSLTTGIQTQVTNLTNLKAKIDADTDVTTARADAKTITGDYRIYALIIPQGYIVASSDRVSTIVGLMTTLQTKLQTRITAAQTAGQNVTTLQSAMTDMTAKLADATSQAQTAQAGVISLVPDQGNSSVATSNHTALLAARTNIKTATQDLISARKDIADIVQGLKAISPSTSTTTQ
jgi:hypothetical protein